MESSIRIQGYVHSVIDPDGAVLLDLRQGKYYSLNGIGAQIWQRLEAGLTVPEIETQLGGLYRAPVETLRADVADFIVSLQRKQLVHV